MNKMTTTLCNFTLTGALGLTLSACGGEEEPETFDTMQQEVDGPFEDLYDDFAESKSPDPSDYAYEEGAPLAVASYDPPCTLQVVGNGAYGFDCYVEVSGENPDPLVVVTDSDFFFAPDPDGSSHLATIPLNGGAKIVDWYDGGDHGTLSLIVSDSQHDKHMYTVYRSGEVEVERYSDIVMESPTIG